MERKPEYNEGGRKGIQAATLEEISTHTGESFVSEEIVVSPEKLSSFLEATGDINTHFSPEAAKESVLAESTKGAQLIPGFLTLSLCANENVLYKALQIEQPNEILSLGLREVKFIAPIPVGSKLNYEYNLSSARSSKIKSRPATKVEWKITVRRISEEKGEVCMEAFWSVAYVSSSENDGK